MEPCKCACNSTLGRRLHHSKVIGEGIFFDFLVAFLGLRGVFNHFLAKNRVATATPAAVTARAITQFVVEFEFEFAEPELDAEAGIVAAVSSLT